MSDLDQLFTPTVVSETPDATARPDWPPQQPAAHTAPPTPAPAEPEPTPAEVAERQATEIQAASEGVVLAERLTCMGKTYRPADKIGLMPLLKWAHTSKHVDKDELEALVSLFDLLKDCVHADDWDRFVDEMNELKAEAEDLLTVVAQVFEMKAARPTKRPGDSSDGQPPTGATSKAALPPGAEELVPVSELMRAG